MRLVIFILCIIISKTGASQVEARASAYETNTLELYYPTYYFFDNLNMRFENPLGNFGLAYYRFKSDKKLGWHVGFDAYQRLDGTVSDPELGDALDRDVFFLSLGLDKRIVVRDRLLIQWFGELNQRYGRELYYGGGSSIVWAIGNRDLIDFGLSLGSKVSYRFNFGLVASLSIKQSFYYYRYDRGLEGLSFDDGSPRNVLNLNLNLGWNFGSQ